eukprot:9489961-Pyramimonas_sp.AAC.1
MWRNRPAGGGGRTGLAGRNLEEVMVELTQFGGAEYWKAHFRKVLRSDPQPGPDGVTRITP